MTAIEEIAPRPAAPRPPVAYGWVIVGVMFVAQMLAIGITSYGFALFVKPIAREYGLPRADVNVGLMLLLVGMALASPLIGRLLDRVPGRVVVTLGALVFGAGAVIIASVKSLLVMAVATPLLLATGTAMLGPLTAATLTARWFDSKRGRALGVVSVATSAGGFVVVPLMAMLVEPFGWRTTLMVLGLSVSVLVGGLGFFFVKDPPTRSAAPQEASGPEGAGEEAARWTVPHLLRTHDFWLIAIAIGLLFGIDQALLASLIAYGTDRGFSVGAAAMLVSAISISAIVGKLVIGTLADRVDLRWLLIGLAACPARLCRLDGRVAGGRYRRGRVPAALGRIHRRPVRPGLLRRDHGVDGADPDPADAIGLALYRPCL
jgi:sugar phosphate permease